MIKILLIDDHTIFRIGFKRIIDNYGDLKLVADYGDPSDILKKIEEHSPDIILCDILMPNANGIDLIHNIKAQYPKLKVAVLSMHKEPEYVAQAIQAGADGYFHKDVSETSLVDGIRRIYNNENYYSQEVSQGIINRMLSQSFVSASTLLSSLTSRELEVIKLICEGLNNHEISERLSISTKTFDNHRANIMNKLKLKNNIQLFRFALENKLIDLFLKS